MSFLAKLNLKTVSRVVNKDPILQRRDKLAAGIDEQGRVLEARMRGEEFTVTKQRWATNDEGQRVQVERLSRVRPWFFEQDNGWYVQCRYGSRILHINGKSNAVFVDKLDEVAAVLAAFGDAAKSGELDKAVLLATEAKG
jgi:hypothetical protein